MSGAEGPIEGEGEETDLDGGVSSSNGRCIEDLDKGIIADLLGHGLHVEP
jgi:hypothetical protein